MRAAPAACSAQGTIILTHRFGVNAKPCGFFNAQKPWWGPDVVGAVSNTLRSTLSPGPVRGTVTLGRVVIASPRINSSVYPFSHVQVPVLRNRQVLVNTCPPGRLVPSGMETSETKA